MAVESPALPYEEFLITEGADQATFIYTDAQTGETHTMDLAALCCSCSPEVAQVAGSTWCSHHLGALAVRDTAPLLAAHPLPPE